MTSKPSSASLTCRAPQTPAERESAITLQYLAEGAANVVFKIQKHTKNDRTQCPFVFVGPRIPWGPNQFLGQVLRVSKGLDKTLTAQEVKRRFDHDIDPLFDTRQEPSFHQHMMPLWLVKLDDSVLEVLNREVERYSPRSKGTIPSGSYGLIMEDMSSEPGRSVTIEIKPKWLAQSPNAPADARRCRTCALQASKDAKGEAAGPYICPLQILHGRIDIIEPFIERKVKEEFARLGEQIKSPQEKHVVQAICHYLASGKGHELLETIRNLQLQHDEKGVLGHHGHYSVSEADHLRLAMTLRDCSLFIRMVYSSDGILDERNPLIEARLGDLDFKSGDKIPDWKTKEEHLIEGGWYTDSGDVPWAHGDCGLA